MGLLVRMCLISSRRMMIWSMSAGRLAGRVETHSITRFDRPCGTMGFRSDGRLDRLIEQEAVVPFFVDGVERGDVGVGERPVDRCAEIEDIGLHADRPAGDLLGGDVIRRALDALLDRADSTCLTKVDDLHHAGVGAEDVVRLDDRNGHSRGRAWPSGPGRPG